MSNIDEILNNFINTKRSDGTRKRYKDNIKELFEFKSITTLDDFKKLNIDDYYEWKNYLLDTGISENSIRPKLSAVSSFYTFLLSKSELDFNKNIIASSDLFKTTKKIVNPQHTTYLTEDEIIDFLRECKTPREKAFCSIFLNTGIRISELINLTLDTFTVFKDENNEEVSTIIVTRKGGKMQEIYFNSFVTKCIKQYLKTRTSTKLNYLFVSNTGKKMSAQSIDTTIKKIKNKAGITKPISAHSLRRTAATDMYKHGFQIEEIQDVLGHSNPGTTQIYLKELQNKSRNVFRNYKVGL